LDANVIHFGLVASSEFVRVCFTVDEGGEFLPLLLEEIPGNLIVTPGRCKQPAGLPAVLRLPLDIFCCLRLPDIHTSFSVQNPTEFRIRLREFWMLAVVRNELFQQPLRSINLLVPLCCVACRPGGSK